MPPSLRVCKLLVASQPSAALLGPPPSLARHQLTMNHRGSGQASAFIKWWKLRRKLVWLAAKTQTNLFGVSSSSLWIEPMPHVQRTWCLTSTLFHPPWCSQVMSEAILQVGVENQFASHSSFCSKQILPGASSLSSLSLNLLSMTPCKPRGILSGVRQSLAEKALAKHSANMLVCQQLGNCRKLPSHQDSNGRRLQH